MTLQSHAQSCRCVTLKSIFAGGLADGHLPSSNAGPHTDNADVGRRVSSLNVESPTDAAGESRTAELHEPAGRPEPARPIKKVRYGRQAFDPMDMVGQSTKPVVNLAGKLLSNITCGVSGTKCPPQ